MGKLAKISEIMYHTGLSRKMLAGARYALLPGDPGRVESIAKGLGEAKPLAVHREYTSYLADLQGEPILVCSTGMGGPSVAIGMEELARLGITHFIRVGTTGSIQEKINLGDMIIAKGAVRLEGTSTHYAPINFPAVADLDLTNAMVAAAQKKKYKYHVGICISSDTFWPGQERYDSFTGYVPRAFQGTLKEWQQLGATNYEMEAATLFVVAQSFGLAAGCICVAVAKRTDSEKVASPAVYKEAMPKVIATVKEALLILLGK
jgi:uridine phosphorylase